MFRVYLVHCQWTTYSIHSCNPSATQDSRNRQRIPIPTPITPYEESQPSSPPTDTNPKPFPQQATAQEDDTRICSPESAMVRLPPIPKIKIRRDNEGQWIKESQDNTK